MQTQTLRVKTAFVWYDTIIKKIISDSRSKRVFVGNNIYENVFPLQVHFHANQTYITMKDFARRLALKQRHKVTRKWPI